VNGEFDWIVRVVSMIAGGGVGGGGGRPRHHGEPWPPARAEGAASAPPTIDSAADNPRLGGWGARARRARSELAAAGEPCGRTRPPPPPAPPPAPRVVLYELRSFE
jgi:hypothetical protein